MSTPVRKKPIALTCITKKTIITSFFILLFFSLILAFPVISISGENDFVAVAQVTFHPKKLNLSSKGNWLTAYITLPPEYLFSDIIDGSILLFELLPEEKRTIEDNVLMVKFPRQEAINLILQTVGCNSPPSVKVSLKISGKLSDGATFEGTSDISINHIEKLEYSGPCFGHQASIVGPLAEAQVSAYRIETLDQAVEGPVTTTMSDDLDAAGSFDLSLTGIDNIEWVMVEISQGKDIDHDSDGTLDPQATINSGTIHALAKAGDWRFRHLRVTPLTELAWRFMENLIPSVSPEDLEIRLGDLAHYLVKTDIDGNGAVDWYDILSFDPSNPSHRDKLATDYDWFFTNDAEGHSIIQSLLAGNEAQMLSCMDKNYTWLMTRFPVPDSRYSSTRLTLSVFGPGSVSSDSYGLFVDSNPEEPVYEDHRFLPLDEASTVTFTAVPADNAKILSWSGCETVSSDLNQCTVHLDRSRSVVANFGRIETTLTGTLHDLSNTNNTLTSDTITVLIPSDMYDLISEMYYAQVNDFVVGDDGGGFLRKITGITMFSQTAYELTTEEASLEDVIEQGTGLLYKQMENGDLEGYVAPAKSGQSATASPMAFTGLDGVRLVPSDNPKERTFTFILGESASDDSAGMSKMLDYSREVTLYDDGQGGTLKANGQITMDISLDTGFDFGATCPWYKGFCYKLKSFKFIAIAEAEESVEFTASTELPLFEAKKKIGTLKFSKISFFIGPVPVWITPTVDIYLFADGNVEAQLTTGIALSQRAEGGLCYNWLTGFSSHQNFTKDFDYTLPTLNLSASLRGGVELSPALMIYDATGPAIPLEGYLKLMASLSTEVIHGCFDVFVEFSVGCSADFMWDMSGDSKIGNMLHLDQLQEMTRMNIFTKEWPIKTWTSEDNCPFAKPSYLLVEGSGITDVIDEGDQKILETNLTIKNTGDKKLYWNTSPIPQEVEVTPSYGEVDLDGQQVVTMSVDTAYLEPGQYMREIFFYNEDSIDTGRPDEQFGNTYKAINITVNDEIDSIPESLQATSEAIGEVTLGWTFFRDNTDPEIPFIGFQIFSAEMTDPLIPPGPENYQLIYTTGIDDRQAVISGLTPDSTYYFKMRVYSNTGANPGPFSDEVFVTVEGYPPLPFGIVISAGQVWMDRNLGASRVAISPTDDEAYGDLYQWGRGTDGHESRISLTTSTLSISDDPGHGDFIMAASHPYDWRTPRNDSLWQGLSGTNNPCPEGFRLPTVWELETERLSWTSNDAAGAFASPLKLVLGGRRSNGDGSLKSVSAGGYYWSSTPSIVIGYGSSLAFFGTSATKYEIQRASGLCIRCIMDIE